jgi:hypothetical protein
MGDRGGEISVGARERENGVARADEHGDTIECDGLTTATEPREMVLRRRQEHGVTLLAGRDELLPLGE